MKIVFLVDDNKTNLETARLELEKMYKTYAMTSAARMFSMLLKITPDIILLDINMPDMDGLEALAKLKGDKKTEQIPIVLLTAHSDKETVMQGLKLGASGYVVKPFAPKLLHERIQENIKA